MSDDGSTPSAASAVPAEIKSDDSSWSIAVKTVGKTFDFVKNHNAAVGVEPSSSGGEGQFTVSVSPDDSMTSLHQQIHQMTGLKPSQQRLIYRGRLIGRSDQLSNAANCSQSATEPTSAASNTNASTNNGNNSSESFLEDHGTSDDTEDTNSSKATSEVQLPVNDLPELTIKEIEGLCDGQTIHLVKRRETVSNTAERTGRTINTNNNNSLESTVASNGNSPLLAALLGLNTDESESAAAPTTPTMSTTPNGRRRLRAAASSRNRSSRRPNYRMTVGDLHIPDPGSMESVRQGLMTVHTMLPHARPDTNSNSSNDNNDNSATVRTPAQDPLRANRQWYRGQWIDCRDTVNQWLEATIADILEPDDILPPRRQHEHDDAEDEKIDDESIAASNNKIDTNIEYDDNDDDDEAEEQPTRPRNPLPRTRRTTELANDPAISAGDMEGRRQLLLEPCDEGDEDEEEGSLAGFRRRESNEGVQVLLIHYNGWPHRWDEWIRSDSERIRPFRTRTRHPNAASAACPTPQSVFHETPTTNISQGGEAEDRGVVLPELARALDAISGLVAEAIGGERNNTIASSTRADNLPWIGSEEDDMTADQGTAAASDAGGEGLAAESLGQRGRQQQQPQYNRRQLELLAPLLDRLGRTLVDVAPHIASHASELSRRPFPPDSESESSSGDDAEEEEDDGIEGGDADDVPDLVTPAIGGIPNPLGWLNRYGRMDLEPALSEMSPAWTNPLLLQGVDPDHIDYASGIVNTTRGEVRSGPRSRAREDDVANLLGAYLAAASLGGASMEPDDPSGGGAGANGLRGLAQLLRDRNGASSGNGGIDIHIHAVVTTPGMDPGGGGTIASLGGGGGGNTGETLLGLLGGGMAASNNDDATAQSIFSSPLRDRRPNNTEDIFFVPGRTPAGGGGNDNDDLFSDLYSESPAPVDHNGNPPVSEQPPSGGLNAQTRDAIATDLGPVSSSSQREADVQPAAASSNDAPSRARRNTRVSVERPNEESNSSNSGGSDRRSGWGRLFRRRSSRRDD